MAARIDDDGALLRELGEALAGRDPGTDPLTASIRRSGYAIYAWRTVEEDLRRASLAFDSRLEPGAAVRSGTSSRMLVFTADPLSVELEVQAGVVSGQIVPPVPGRIEVQTPDGVTLAVDSDELGFFTFPRPAPGPVRLRCETETSRLVTDWVQL